MQRILRGAGRGALPPAPLRPLDGAAGALPPEYLRNREVQSLPVSSGTRLNRSPTNP